MKTSFYFVIWIIIYPLLGLLHNPVVNQNSFIIALVVVWALSYWINRSMPDTIRYEAAESRARINEEIYSGNIESFRKRISRQATIQFVTAIYFGATLVFVLFSIFRHSDVNDWIALVLFGIFAYSAITGANQFYKANHELRQDPSRETAGRVARNVYRLDFDAYRSRRDIVSGYSEMLPPRPCHFQAFRIFSLIVAVVCIILGLFYLLRAILLIVAMPSADGISAGIMYVLYGSLATYFGIRDTVSLSK